MRSLLLACSFCLAAPYASAQRPAVAQRPAAALRQPAGLERRIADMVAEASVARAHWGVAVVALNGSTIASVNATQLFQPASNNKLFTTAAATALLGPAATVTTEIVQRGTLAGGTLTGDLALLGAGDANFAVDDVPYMSPTSVRARHEAEGAPGSAQAMAKTDRDAHPLRQLETMADAIVAAGVTHVTGDIVGDDTRFPWEPYPEAWAIDDMLWGYGAPVSALTIHDNQIVLRVRAGAAAGLPATAELERNLPALYTVNATGLSTGPARSGTHVGISRTALASGRPGELRVWGAIAADAPEDVELIAIDDPADFAARALKAMLEARGVTISGVARAKHRLPLTTRGFQQQVREAGSSSAPVCGTAECRSADSAAAGEPVLASIRSPTVAEDVLLTNKVSQNLHAELLLSRLAGSATQLEGQPETGPAATPRVSGEHRMQSDAGSRAEGARLVRRFLERAGLDSEDFIFFDGSGLSTHDLVTPGATAKLLVWASSQPWFAGWKASLPIGGVDGSLVGRFNQPPLRGQVFAKTGTLGEARALSGYLQCASGRTVVFAIMVDNHSPGAGVEREVMDRIVAAIYAAE